MIICPCGSDKDYARCCGRFLEAGLQPSTPLELMRSRYTAFTQANVDYLTKTMRTPATDQFDPISTKKFAESVTWLKLEIINSLAEHDTGLVEFIAHYIENEQRQVIHERSLFQRVEGRWYYVSGVDPSKPIPKPKHPVALAKRNEPCVCGSGKKYKKCCG